MSDEIETREVRARFVSHHAEGARVHKEHSRQAFNAWLDAELRKAKAEALREAATELGAVTVHWSNDGENTRAAWLRRRAARVEEDQ